MLLLEIQRGMSTDYGTFSGATLSDVQFIWLELPERGNAANFSCIPAGDYIANTFDSPHLGYTVYKLEEVPERQDIELHIANWAGDTTKGYYSELLGCGAMGYGVADLVTPKGRLQRGITHSAQAFKDFMRICGGSTLHIRILPALVSI